MRVHILGLGPAGVLLARRALARGWEVHGYDPAGLRVWDAIYGMLDQDLPAWLEPFLSPSQPLTAVTSETVDLPYSYRMLLNERLVDSVSDVIVHEREAQPSEFDGEVVLDCRGARTESALWQVAVGFVLNLDAEAPLFMDWRQTEEHSGQPSFLYVQPLEDGWLYEETILATTADCQQAQVREELQELLTSRLRNRLGLGKGTDVLREEYVFIPMGTRYRQPRTSRHILVGARGGAINPATGYSVGAVAGAADCVLDNLEQGRRPRVSVRVNSLLAHVLRNIGGELIATAHQITLTDFFACFFRLSRQHQVNYLTGEDGIAVARTMWALRKETTMRHEFLKPLFQKPWRIVLPAMRRSFYTEKPYTEKPK